MTTEGKQRLVDASRLYGRACRLLDDPADQEAESLLRASLRGFRSAMNWLEDTPDFEVAHQRLDAAGHLAREAFPGGCRLAYREGTYLQECPAALAHNRVGLSPGILVRAAECSICSQDPEDCSHITGRVYDGARCIRIITSAEILEVSVVGRPASPDARFDSLPVSLAALREQLGERFSPGTPVTCGLCLRACTGVARPFEGAGHGSWTGI